MLFHSRPVAVCWCSDLPLTPLDIKSKIYVLQHPLEEKRNLRTAKIIELLCPNNCFVIRSRKFSSRRNALVKSLMESPERERTLLLYPGPNARKLADIPAPAAYNICILDGEYLSPFKLIESFIRSFPIRHMESGTINVQQQPGAALPAKGRDRLWSSQFLRHSHAADGTMSVDGGNRCTSSGSC